MNKAMVIFLSGIFLCSLASAQQVYKWVDSKGKVHYGDMPTAKKPKKVDTTPPMKGANGKSGGTCPYAK
ncbi:MAG: DUF4124 domain-containing protein [Oxalobacter sp.]|nr:MAG: DUF4124 domain-containing protein [Oxalobacter sp.]